MNVNKKIFAEKTYVGNAFLFDLAALKVVNRCGIECFALRSYVCNRRVPLPSPPTPALGTCRERVPLPFLSLLAPSPRAGANIFLLTFILIKI